MKKDSVPQDPSALDKFTREVCYATDKDGKYVTTLSRGWEVKANALGVTWEEIQLRIEEARKKVELNEASPLLFFMEARLMDIPIVAAYTGLWKWRVKRHMRPDIFPRLSKRILAKYAEAFNVGIEDLQTMTLRED